MAKCHTVPRPVSFTWQCVIRYHDQCLSPGNVSYGTTTSIFHMHKCCTETTWYKCRRLASITFSRFVQIAIFVFWFSLKKRFQCLLSKAVSGENHRAFPVYMVLRSNNYNNLVKTWSYSSLKEFEQTMLSISEISRLYSLRSLKKTLNVSHLITKQPELLEK
jgi:hypothetical protein